MKKTIKDMFSSGELSKLCNIPRKTLLYYDSIGLITPELICDNGFRYYSRRQLITLEIILSLRSLEVSIAEIQEYLNNKSPDNLKELLEKKRRQLFEEQELIQRKIIGIASEVNKIEGIASIELDTLLIVQTPEEYLHLSKEMHDTDGFKTKTTLYAESFMDYYKQNTFNDHELGYIVDRKLNLNEGIFNPLVKYYYHHVLKSDTENSVFVKPAGNFLEIYQKGIYCNNKQIFFKPLLSYIEDNNLETVGDFYVSQIINFWLSSNNKDYITKISIKIK